MFPQRTRTHTAEPAVPAYPRIPLSVLEPTYSARPFIPAEAIRARDVRTLDVRGLDLGVQESRILQYAEALGENEYLDVTLGTLNLAALAALAANGHRYQVTARESGAVRIAVWRFLSADQRKRYLKDNVDEASIVRRPAGT